MGHLRDRRGRVAVADERGRSRVIWWAAGLVTAGLLASAPSWGQTAAIPGTQPGGQTAIPDVVTPRSGSSVLPPGAGGGVGRAPRSETPLVEGRGRPVPDAGVIAPPVPGLGSTPVIPPPGSPGGDKRVVPK